MIRDLSDLKHRIILEAPVETDDGAGGVIRTFAPLATLWASLTPLSGQPHKGEDRLLGSVTHKIIIRERAGITRLHRFTWQSRVFLIRYFAETHERGGCFHTIYVEEQRP